jgi:hypothetical protein
MEHALRPAAFALPAPCVSPHTARGLADSASEVPFAAPRNRY